MKNRKRFARLMVSVISVLVVLSTVLAALMLSANKQVSDSGITRVDGQIITNKSEYYDDSVIYRLPDSVKDTDELSLIVQVADEALVDAYRKTDKSQSLQSYLSGEAATAARAEIATQKKALLEKLDALEIDYLTGADYANVVSGFELTVKAGDFEALCKGLGEDVTVIVSEVYQSAETQLVDNNVDVYDTGIFDSSDFAYDGSGVVVAVLDTGLDYNHSAFSVSNFTSTQLGLTFDEVAERLANTKAAAYESGLTASDVYINEKIPFAYDYADRNSDVFPIDNDHGTHVAGVIAGKDSVITGVAPNAQLVIMKTFSDVQDSARSSWILSALEDCVAMGVDVINMSLGTACGFSRESDKEAISGVYDKIRDQGISLVVAASNSYTSTYGSEKNGNLGLTSNPDTGTVGSPGTYDGALSVASINGAKTPYLLYNDTIIYFTESSDRVSEEKNFFDEFFAAHGGDSAEIEYVVVPGVGRSADYTGLDVTGKIALIRRGDTTFEEKANMAQEKGAAGVIIYNNVSGDIKMNVGDTTIPVCSIKQDAGEMLAAAGSGIIKISRSQTSGPFMSDFSSWGPTPDLGIKPEITAHGGEIYSAIPGQEYDRMSGTSMACPNMAGVCALLRQYVTTNFPEIAGDPVEVTAFVNRLLMSTADIIINTNGLPYAVRKQGAGLANLNNAAATTAYLLTYDRVDGSVMDKSKIELGDDPTKSGVYTLKFSIKNFGTTDLSYDLSSYVMTEGVSDTKTNDGKTTVTEQGYVLGGAVTQIVSLTGGTQNGNTVSVAAGQTADVTVTITLSAEDKNYLDTSFANGMYVEGFLILTNRDESGVDLSVPYLAYYGDWTVAPLFDLDYFATNKDELDDSIDLLDKTLPDAYATRPIGGIESDYVSYLGSYYFEQNPASKQISANRDYISLSNQEGTVHSLRFVWAGLLRNAARMEITITENSTGEVVFTRVDEDIRKSYGDGGPIYPANIDIEFDAIEQNLKNNTQYTVKLVGYLDYGDGGEANNLKNEFEFPLYTDFEAPTVTGCEFYTEYDKSAKKARLFAKVAIYDNHYSMSALFGYVGLDTEGAVLNGFDRYMTPIYSNFNSTSYVVYELTDYLDEIRENSANRNTFTVACYDYALNEATYEIELPDTFTDFYFAESENGLTLSPNEIYTLNPLVYPGTEWNQLLEYSSTNLDVARVVNNKLVAVGPGVSIIKAWDPETKQIAEFKLTVLSEGDEGYVKYDKPVADSFTVTGYYTNKAYYYLSSTEREIGSAGDERKFVSNHYYLSMFPSESVTLRYDLDAYFPDATTVKFESSNESLVTVDQNGVITARAEGFASITVRVLMDGKNTYYSQSINVTIKDPYILTGPSLTHYFGLGGKVEIPKSLAITAIGDYAFSNYDYIDKGPEDVISDEDPEYTKPWFLGDNTIEEVIIPDGVETIGAYAFANLTALKSVTIPASVTKIEQGAFYGCTSLTTVNGLEHVKFVNQAAFEGCNLSGALTLTNMVAVADYAFAGNENLTSVDFASTGSIGAYAFAGNVSLKSVTFGAEKIKLGQYAFSSCKKLNNVAINAAVIPAGTFNECEALTNITLGRDVAVIGEYAFRDTSIDTFTVAEGNTAFQPIENGRYLLNAAGNEILLASTSLFGKVTIDNANITSIANGAFAGNATLTEISIPGVTQIGDFAFAGCTRLQKVSFAKLTKIGSNAFGNTKLAQAPDLSGLSEIGSGAFAGTALTEITIPDGMKVGRGAFANCLSLATVVIGDNVTLESYAFYVDSFSNWTYSSYKDGGKDIYYYVYKSPLHSLTIGENATIGNYAFHGAAELTEVALGSGATVGDYAFYNAVSLTSIDLSAVKSIGSNAFSGDLLYEYTSSGFTTAALTADGAYRYHYYAPALTSVNLAAASTLGSGAFAYCQALTTVTLGNGITVIPQVAFRSCGALENINLAGVQSIGNEAFAETALKKIDLSSATEIGTYAFVYDSKLTEVTLNPNGCEPAEGAFAYCAALQTVNGMSAVTRVGDYAFAYTALTSADLSGATAIGDHAFMKETPTAFDVTLGEGLTELGENPFAMCLLKPFSATVTESFNGKDYTTEIYTFNINNIRIIEGSLYREVPNGLVLVTYAGDADRVTVAEGTVRISARAFAGTNVQSVVFPYTLKAVGHMALYGCEELSLVTFASYEAPILEEEYDYNYYISYENLPAAGEFEFETLEGERVVYTGIEIVPYFMWNVTSNPTNVYYGANFVNYIGHESPSLVMVRPVNGQHYDSFILSQYFNLSIDGAAAADEVTLAAIAAINRLPETVQLTDKALVEAARAAYDKIATLEQRALVTNYDRLTTAEQRIIDLEHLQNSGTPTPPEEPAPVDETPKLWQIVLVVTGTVAVIIVAGALLLILTRHKRAKEKKQPEEGPSKLEKGTPSAEQKVGKAEVSEAVTDTPVSDIPEAEADAQSTEGAKPAEDTAEENSEKKSDDESERA